MCTYYDPAQGEFYFGDFGEVSDQHRVPLRFSTAEGFKATAWPGYLAPVITRFDAGLVRLGRFGMLGQHGQPVLVGPNQRPASTHNSRSEDAQRRPTYRHAWKHLQTCIIPAHAFYEPCYERGDGKSFPMRIARADGKLMAIAGLCERHLQADAVAPLSMTMLTVNADGHPLMSRMHRPEDEKRSLVVLEADEILDWLRVSSEDEMRSYIDLFEPAVCVATEAPAPARAAKKGRGVEGSDQQTLL